MVGWIARILLLVAGSITSWFVARDAYNFDTIQLLIAIFLFMLIVFIAAFWSKLTGWIRHLKSARK